ncbi:hypothetical protein HII36_11985 [Nonomuraea sp. NN258]|uniref:hypothetical protein n=1 Tax=Nonomuraea antri TaxID=2730852 RepID=UPI00156A1635|nr:hypothetical protein [Nonomuraea antri]NRQ32553.1 hypothetical protein [Nonomuraea antri]
MIRVLDLERLAVERGRVAPEDAGRIQEPVYGVLHSLRMWEVLIRDMEEGWPYRYLVYEYINDLTVRDGLDEYGEALRGTVRDKFAGALERLDARFRAVTREDGGAELARYWRPVAEGRETRWWWARRPEELPEGW